MAYSVNREGALSTGVDVFGNPAWDAVRLKAQEKALALREQGFVGAAMLPMTERSTAHSGSRCPSSKPGSGLWGSALREDGSSESHGGARFRPARSSSDTGSDATDPGLRITDSGNAQRRGSGPTAWDPVAVPLSRRRR